MAAVKAVAEKEIHTPMVTDDIEVEIIYSTTVSGGMRADVDNIIKPTLDALVGVAFDDDKRVRSVTATVFDRTRGYVVDGRVEHMGTLFYTSEKHVILISIYSDVRLMELGGEKKVSERRSNEVLQRLQRLAPDD